MSIQQMLEERADSKCELCESSDNLSVFEVAPVESNNSDKCILVCGTCSAQLQGEVEPNDNHWRCLGSSMWSTVPAVQIVSWRMLKQLSSETWALDLLDMLYFEDDMLSWAEAGLQSGGNSPTFDSNGTELKSGDTVTLVKDLDVKGGGFTAKRGTTVKKISLTDNPEQIEGRVNGVRIVLLTKFLKKAS